MKIKNYLFLLILFASKELLSQELPLHISHSSIYEFLDRMANNRMISLNSCIKPYSREEVCQKLLEIQGKSDKLSENQRKELKFFLMEFNLEREAPKKDYRFNLLLGQKNTNLNLYPLGFFHGTKNFKLSIKPALGIQGFIYGKSKESMLYHRWAGVQMQGYISKYVSFYMSLTDHRYSLPVTGSRMLTNYPAAILKGQFESTDFAEAKGGLTLSYKWASLSIQKDNIQWGNNYNSGNIFSGRTPSFALLKLRLKPVKWFEFNYFHGWLASDVVDNSRTAAYSKLRLIMRDKKVAANMLTFTPCKGLDISIGNSIVYADKGFQFQYIIPFLFYKATDDVYNATNNSAGNNSQIYFEISTRNIKHFHLYVTLFVDEISFERMFKKDKQSNYLSLKTGFRLSDLPKNVNFTFEYTANTPNVYQSNFTAQDFTTSGYNLGSYLNSNAQEYYGAVNYRPLPLFAIDLSYTCQMKGTDYVYGVGEPWGLPFMKDVVLRNDIIALKLSYEFLNNSFLSLEFYGCRAKGQDVPLNHPLNPKKIQKTYIQEFNPPYFQRPLSAMIMAGVNIGF